MIIEDWSLIKENSNNEYCQIDDNEKKFIKGILKRKDSSETNIMTASIAYMNFDKAECNNKELFTLGNINSDYKNYLDARKNNNGIISNWFLYNKNNFLRIKAILNDDTACVIDDEILSYNPINNEIILKNQGKCFIIVESINEFAKQFLLVNNRFKHFQNHSITNIQNYVVDLNVLEVINNEIEEQKIKIMKKKYM